MLFDASVVTAVPASEPDQPTLLAHCHVGSWDARVVGVSCIANSRTKKLVSLRKDFLKNDSRIFMVNLS